MGRSTFRQRYRFPTALLLALASLAGSVEARSGEAVSSAAGERARCSMLIRAYAFDRGNVRTIAAGSYADAEPVVINGGALPNVMEYDIEFPVTATYTLHARYASLEPRPVDVFLDGARIGRGLGSVTGSWQSSSARWERVSEVAIARGKHTVKLQCPGPCIPHIVALRLDSSEAFPEGWKLRRPGARSLSAAHLGQVAGYDNGKDGYEGFVREDGFVNVPDDYNPIIRFERRPLPAPRAHRILEYALYFAALDENFMEIQRMRSFTELEPGQTVTCVGCHEDRRSAPPNRPAVATRRAPSEIEPPPGGARAPDFVYDVQPVLDEFCVSCHSGDRIDGGVDLAADRTNLFNVAYETLTAGYVNYVNIYSSATLALRPPRYYGSHASKLIEVLQGEHRKHVTLPRDAFRKIVTWIDCNAPYYGTYRYTRPGTTGGRELVSGAVRATLEKTFQDRCASCHGGDTGRVRRIRFPHIERSPALTAPLSKRAGGSGRCGEEVFADRSDPAYRAMLAALQSLRREVQKNPRVDQLAQRPPVYDDTAPYRYR